MYLDRITQAWDWRTQGTGRDRERLWRADRPAATLWLPNPISNPAQGQWNAIGLTDLFNAWQDGSQPNYGVQLRPVNYGGNNFNEFASSENANAEWHPKLVVTPSR